MGKKISIAEASRLTGVAINTLKTWDNTDGKFKSSFRTSGGHRRYDLDDVEAFIGKGNEAAVSGVPKVFIYCRVSTRKQAENGNLERQKNRLVQHCIEQGFQIMGIFEETASGLNDHRRELTKMFRRLSEINQIVVECPDRLARFGYAYLVEFAEAFNVAIEAVEEKESVSANEELVSDLIGIVTCFSARLYGARGGRKVGKHLEKALSEIERGELGDEDHDAVRADSVDKGAD